MSMTEREQPWTRSAAGLIEPRNLMIDAETGIVCTATELYYLSAILGGPALLGIADPFPGWLTEEIEAGLQQAATELAKRQYIQFGAGGQVDIDQRVAALVDALVFPTATFHITHTIRTGQAAQHMFHAKDPLPLAVEVVTTDDTNYHLAPLGGADEILRRVMTIWGLTEPAIPATVHGGSVSEATLLEARTAAADGPGPAECVLARSDLDRDTAHIFAQALASPRCTGVLIALRRTEYDWNTAALTMLDSPAGLWRLRPYEIAGKSYVELIPCTTTAFAGVVRDLMASFVEFALVSGDERWSE